MRRNPVPEKNRSPTRTTSKAMMSQDEVGRWLGERLKAALSDELAEKPEMTQMPHVAVAVPPIKL
jgi:hypothetical protein